MKKILYTFLGLGALLATSCNMDHEPVGSIPDDKAFESITDVEYFRNGFYNRVRSLSTGGYISYTEIQMDQFLGTAINGNRIGTLNNGQVMSNDGDIESIWAGLYSGIADCNYFLERAPKLVEEGKVVLEEDIQQLNHYVAESRFIRAFFYYWLMDHYCPQYTDATKDQKYGLPLVTVYYPTADRNYYPERSTLAETYKFIEDELDEALAGLEEWEALPNDGDVDHKEALKTMSPYVCSWTVKALQARVALIKGDYATAKSKAQEVMNSGIYRLVTRNNYKRMWTDDSGNELIFRPISTAQELGISSTGSAWLGASEYQADYIPTPYVATQGSTNLYDTGDIRYDTFVGERNLLVEGSLVKSPVFTKFPGNTSLQTTSTPNIMNMAKPFRLSEMLLIVAEASAETGDEATANDMIETLRKARIRGYSHTDLSGTALINDVRKERNRELIGEGFRMSDMRRWGLGFNRADNVYPTFPQAGTITNLSSRNVVYQINDYRYTWPLPATELQTNPQISNQQNPGY